MKLEQGSLSTACSRHAVKTSLYARRCPSLGIDGLKQAVDNAPAAQRANSSF
ncbi:hypothetical protein SAMN05216421_1479 [Halopseudomonas xinjiangensis]|uniref:Uncharacterized protein n=1 Tax=Halopseudomonas xinjiangensis TaxID=487184 RepID=A0A1H1RZS3_9GAMM|nr:hypothetical protein SAMN05216421_1479 [Halopseudomonas xinjiangensis]